LRRSTIMAPGWGYRRAHGAIKKDVQTTTWRTLGAIALSCPPNSTTIPAIRQRIFPDLLTSVRSPSRAQIHPKNRAANHRNRRRQSTVSAPIHDQNLPRITRTRTDSRAVHRHFQSKIRNGFGSPAAGRTPTHEQNRSIETAATSPRAEQLHDQNSSPICPPKLAERRRRHRLRAGARRSKRRFTNLL
jgi:hypothetical protein